MAIEQFTFRNPQLAFYQSLVVMLERAKRPQDASTPGKENDVVNAAFQVATLSSNNLPIPAAAPSGVPDAAWTTARLTFEMLQARLRGNVAEADALEAELAYGEFDPRWTETIAQYTAYFGVGGAQKAPEYISANPDMQPLPFNTNATVALIADWGTGTETAASLLALIAQHDPDIVIHLGDIYYSGTPEECDRNFTRLINSTFDRTKVAIYNLAGNHDMYCGGVGYYNLLKTINQPTWPQQPASFFYLRSTDNQWQFVAMDTGHTDYDR
ncbi:metallophosphoesterase [Acidisphaera sp. S103]|uniref:metallophosphoesterase family protein n=1 Tax=Acidisphaera sp. S103 TaxID=1747223 RepID=UPI00131BBC9E|nr:metallophosphoesterase [Acidisphaera sp. S103]